MNKLFIIGNLVRDPESRVAAEDRAVCNFTVAVNRYTREGQVADYVRVAAWDELGKNCQRYLGKGKRVCVVGRASTSAYVDREGSPRAVLELSAQEVEFLTPRGQTEEAAGQDKDSGFVKVDEEDVPFV